MFQKAQKTNMQTNQKRKQTKQSKDKGDSSAKDVSISSIFSDTVYRRASNLTSNLTSEPSASQKHVL